MDHDRKGEEQVSNSGRQLENRLAKPGRYGKGKPCSKFASNFVSLFVKSLRVCQKLDSTTRHKCTPMKSNALHIPMRRVTRSHARHTPHPNVQGQISVTLKKQSRAHSHCKQWSNQCFCPARKGQSASSFVIMTL